MTIAPEVVPVSLDALPSMPAAAVRIVGLCDDPNVELKELAEAVALDPALSARILRIANSAAYSRGNDVTSVDRAMMLMGIKLVKLTALGFVVSDTLSGSLEDGSDVAGQVWRQCLVKAIACRELAQLAGLRSTPEAFLAGLFDGMGQLLAMVTRPELFGPMIQASPFPNPSEERAVLGMSTSELVRGALTTWGVPELYARVVEACDGDEAFDQSEVGRLAATLVLARAATCQLLGHPTDPAAAEPARVSLDLAVDAVDTIAVDLGTHVAGLADTMGIHLGAEVDFTALLAQARSKMIETTMQIAEESLRQTTQINDLEDQRDALRRESLTDRLTGLPNRRDFDETLHQEIENRITGRTVSGALGLAMIDIDHFKQVNDKYGHRAGDLVLAAVGATLAATSREGEMAARYGGEEFVLIMPIVESAEALAAAAERFRREIAAQQIDVDGLILNVTASIGAIAATSFASQDAATALTEAADRLLYQAKHGGRNTTRTEFVGPSVG